MQLRKVTPARAQKGYRNDGDGADRLHQALHERQLLQASDMMHATLMLMSSVVGVPLPKMQQPRQRERRRPSHFWYEDAHTWKIVVCTWAAARQAMVRVRYFLGGEDGAVDSKNGGWRPVHRRGRDRGLAQECRPVRRGCGAAPLGLSPTSFEALCACTCCGTPLFIPLARGASSAVACMAATIRQGDTLPPYRLRCVTCGTDRQGCQCGTGVGARSWWARCINILHDEHFTPFRHISTHARRCLSRTQASCQSHTATHRVKRGNVFCTRRGRGRAASALVTTACACMPSAGRKTPSALLSERVYTVTGPTHR
jgi:hypothetical protein